jgi:hypothetical protein
MLGSPILDLAIGMVFIYLLLSLVCTATKELLEAWLKKRATDLEAGIRALLQDDSLAGRLYEHPLIAGLSVKKGEQWTRTNWPSYIPAPLFAQALLDLLLPPPPAPPGGAAAPGPNPPAPAPAPPPPARTLREILGDLPDTPVRKALLAFVDSAGNDLQRLRGSVEAWFNSAMDRVSGWYKRWSQVVILFLGLGITVALNADSIALGDSLARDPEAVKRLINAAEQYTKRPPTKQEPAAAPATKGKEDKGSGEGAPKGTAATPSGDREPAEPNALRESLDRVGALSLPVGWDRNDPRTVPTDFWGWLRKVGGWFLTAFAVSLGAPFWFDLLNKFMVVRATVKPHEKSPEVASRG